MRVCGYARDILVSMDITIYCGITYNMSLERPYQNSDFIARNAVFALIDPRMDSFLSDTILVTGRRSYAGQVLAK